MMSNPAATQELLASIQDHIGPALVEADNIFQRELRSRHGCVQDIVAHAARFHGKRLRPILLLLTADACGGIRPQHITLAAVVEMIHMATLVHDDILDEADSRRHVATVNTRWSNETSVLFGDYLFTHAFHLAAGTGSAEACRLIGRSTNRVCEGEMNQVSQRGNLDLAEDRYFEIIDGKTAELCAVCCELGAIFADADSQTVTALTQYGRSLGLAFQIADDLLDLRGDERHTGKTLGSDLDKQKLTLPIIRLLQTASIRDATAIRQLLAQPDGRTRGRLQHWFDSSDAFEYTQAKAEEHVATARAQLTCLADSPSKRILETVTEFVVQRSF